MENSLAQGLRKVRKATKAANGDLVGSLMQLCMTTKLAHRHVFSSLLTEGECDSA